jgi:hypothetical protein
MDRRQFADLISQPRKGRMGDLGGRASRCLRAPRSGAPDSRRTVKLDSGSA